jgi:hypothetical protein
MALARNKRITFPGGQNSAAAYIKAVVGEGYFKDGPL